MGIARDGIRVGRQAPVWAANDAFGALQQCPNRSAWQVLVFADQELAFFSDLAAGLNHIRQSEPLVDVVIVSSRSREICQVIAETLELTVPIVPDSTDLYRRFRVRVRPFVHVIDPKGIVRAKGIANYEETVRAFLRWARSSTSASLQATKLPA